MNALLVDAVSPVSDSLQSLLTLLYQASEDLLGRTSLQYVKLILAEMRRTCPRTSFSPLTIMEPRSSCLEPVEPEIGNCERSIVLPLACPATPVLLLRWQKGHGQRSKTWQPTVPSGAAQQQQQARWVPHPVWLVPQSYAKRRTRPEIFCVSCPTLISLTFSHVTYGVRDRGVRGQR